MHGPGFFQTADWPWDSTLDQFASAERIAKKRGITRAECDALALRSQTLAIKAREEGRFKREILPIDAPVLGDDGQPTGTTRTIVADQGVRASTRRRPRRAADARRGRRPHGGQLVADLRRRRGDPLDDRRARQGARPEARAPASSTTWSSAAIPTTCSTVRSTRPSA